MTPVLACPQSADWAAFRHWAVLEGWRVPARELELFQGPFADSALVLCRGDQSCGVVTALRHEQSGWIGNLLVPAAYRRRGYGSRLFDAALDQLQVAGCDSLWLTASEQGRPLYERRGFRAVDAVERWVICAIGGDLPTSSSGLDRLRELDRQSWQESRQRLLPAVAAGGAVFTCGETAALLQAGDGMRILGPWYSPTLCPRENRQIIAAAVDAAATGCEVVADVLASSPLSTLLRAAGFTCRGRSALMVRGVDRFERKLAVSLASLGSMG